VLDLRLCQKCPQGEFDDTEYDDTGEICHFPSVTCQKAFGAVLLMDDEHPEGCLYALEHLLSTQNIPESHARRMSGRQEDDEAEL